MHQQAAVALDQQHLAVVARRRHPDGRRQAVAAAFRREGVPHRLKQHPIKRTHLIG
jgi:hypothetical protein